MAGSDKKITLWNKDGVLLGTIGEMKDWIWSTAVNPVSKHIFAGANDGHLSMHNVEFSTIHGLY
jgi:intraflagellar transport protein 122